MGEVFYRVADHYVSIAWGDPVLVDVYDLSGDFSRTLEVSGGQADIASILEGELRGKVKIGLTELGQAIHQYFETGQEKSGTEALTRFQVPAEELADVGLD